MKQRYELKTDFCKDDDVFLIDFTSEGAYLNRIEKVTFHGYALDIAELQEHPYYRELRETVDKSAKNFWSLKTLQNEFSTSKSNSERI